MKISRWHLNFSSFCRDGGPLLLIIPFFLLLMGGAVWAHVHHSNEIHRRFPIGKHVVFKGSKIEGTVESVSGCGCDITVLVADKEGHLTKNIVDANVLE